MHPNDHPERRHRPGRPPGTNGDTDTDVGTEAENEPGSEDRSAVRRATGRAREEWFALLDAWGATARSPREITAWLAETHGVSRWWAQKLRITYEQARGVRGAGARADGTYAATASRTVAVSPHDLFEAVVDPETRRRWLPDARLRLRTSRPERSARFDWDDGATRVVFEFRPTGESGCVVAVEHQRLPSSADVDERRAYWRERLTVLRDLLEGGQGNNG